MKRVVAMYAVLVASGIFAVSALAEPPKSLDGVLLDENKSLGVTAAPLRNVNDLAFLRRVTVDLIGRIPTTADMDEYLSWPAANRRQRLVDKLLQDDRFADRWTTFYGDFMRLRSGAEGGAALTAFVHEAIKDGMPYDELTRRLIAAGGKSGNVAEVGFILSDNADPMQLAGITSQVFMGVRMACAECHDHPFDQWTRKDFYGLAAFFGKTRRVERRLGQRIFATYTTDIEQTSVLWPPEGQVEDAERKPMAPTFPIKLASGKNADYIARLLALRKSQIDESKKVKLADADQQSQVKKVDEGPDIDDLLTDAGKKADRRAAGKKLSVADLARKEIKEIQSAMSDPGSFNISKIRLDLARLVTDPRNRYFSRSFVNRVWAELIGRGIVTPVDDFSSENKPTHPQLLDFMADEFVANGYDFRSLVRMIVTSDIYQREHAGAVSEEARTELEAAYLAVPIRRMISETLYDSIVVAGHLFDVKHEAGKNLKTVWSQARIMKAPAATVAQKLESVASATKKMDAMKKEPVKLTKVNPYDLESAIEIDFNAVLNRGKMAVKIEQMQVKSKEEIEAERMAAQASRINADYFDRFIKTVVDDNPKFTSSLRMAAPAAPEHFLRVFGQPGRTELGDFRDDSSSMRQALMILNGRLTNEAARVGELEPVYQLLVGETVNVAAAIRLAYAELLTREPTAEELSDGKTLLTGGESLLAGMADLRWVLLNSNEFRFIP